MTDYYGDPGLVRAERDSQRMEWLQQLANVVAKTHDHEEATDDPRCDSDCMRVKILEFVEFLFNSGSDVGIREHIDDFFQERGLWSGSNVAAYVRARMER